MASGVFSSEIGALNPVGVACGLLSAVSCTCFMFFSSRVGCGLPPIQRGFVACLGACVLGFALCPDYFASGVLQNGIWGYRIGESSFRTASSELPCGIALSALVIGEPVEALQIVGIVAILAGIVISQLPHLRTRVEPPSGEATRPA